MKEGDASPFPGHERVKNSERREYAADLTTNMTGFLDLMYAGFEFLDRVDERLLHDRVDQTLTLFGPVDRLMFAS